MRLQCSESSEQAKIALSHRVAEAGNHAAVVIDRCYSSGLRSYISHKLFTKIVQEDNTRDRDITLDLRP